ncbi:hypothetical protein GCK72_003341 [Caenorhabditis remanei]|uniref:SCP domain-containing protein n=1 Tax=Caenorhabditis remanei TaxID=31234 RepID=A0A6A5HX63_CAERE|nr:hypothetical protein GCK72_003341 [Caenorhabditis remanei]KAF1771514.1 hypothetical protein GCK72_003341 [Caenorhabditis remanei]
MLYSIVTILIVMMGRINIAGAIIPPNGMDEEQLEFIDKVNQLRQTFAVKFKIQNMQMLIWSKELQNAINESMHHGNLAHFSVRKWRLVELDDYKQTNDMKEKLTFDFVEYSVKYIENFTLSDVYHGELELYNSHQNEIGCARFKSGYRSRVTCLIGPNGPLAPAPRYQSDQKCTSPLKFDEVNGLCTPPDLFADSRELMFIGVLNEKRRQYAKDLNIANLHELTWSKNLKTTAAILNFDSILPSNRAYRIIAFKKYSNGLEYCDQNCPTLKFPTDGNQEETFYMGFEQYHPKQTEIACVNKKDGNNGNNIMCLLGPKADFRVGQAEFITGVPGSNCTMGYENKNALCSKSKLDAQATVEASPTSPPKETTPKLVQQPPPPPPTSAPSTEVTVEPAQPPPPTTTQPPPKDSDDGTCPNTPPGPSQTRFTTEKVTPEPPPTHPPELADYEEIDGDEYDEDFPTGSPPSQNVYWYNDSRCGGGGLVLLLSLFVFFVFV